MAMQESLIKSLHKHTGALYLGLDAWQSPNGFDILGTVIYRLVQTADGGYIMTPLSNSNNRGCRASIQLWQGLRFLQETPAQRVIRHQRDDHCILLKER
ncbi:hypothetical protein Pst134EA_011675 [Puccinia striiformis f. sp. tritici]|uniref:hypothetical protein n=1 Tax=Puccinia striiformis f. sp. tritici TaxID=168172 RepID=UPI0020076243|nr:hypothetical protein Pst134EA_011675 [Puccinia striiformis f. sp. tritici]KAH9468055.1 hypothetical protein Pst134EA_011675 [Puccinia striiformis f. sp. tritici]